jgi:4-amino-4-deoxy-L-arabinose transferase-like glycosyltransferase
MERAQDEQNERDERERAGLAGAARKGTSAEEDTSAREGGEGAPVADFLDRWSRSLALGIAALVLFPSLGQSGIWDPYELDAGDLARRIAIQVFHAGGLAFSNANNGLPTLSDLRMGELPFTSMALGFKLFGLHDWAGRLPLALWAFAGIAAVHALLSRLVSRRAGLYAAIALVTMPLYFMQARTMLGDVVTMAAFTLAFSGLIGAMLDDEGPRALGRRLAWGAVGLAGLAAGYMSRGLVVGVASPALAVGLAWVVIRGAGAAGGAGRAPSSWERDAAGALSLAVGLVALAMGLRLLLRASPEQPLLRALGFAVQKRAPLEATFDLSIRQLGHGLFPWSALLPFAIGRALRAPVSRGDTATARAGEEREAAARVALLVGAAVAYGASTLIAPYAGATAYAAPALLAGLAAVAVVDLERGAPPSRALALGCVVLGLVLYADIAHEPERAMSAFGVDKPQFPKSFEADGGRRMAYALALFVGLVSLTWFEAQPRGADAPARRPRLGPWAADMRRAYREGFAELSAIWNGNLLFGLVVVEAALFGIAAALVIGRRIRWAPVMHIPSLGVTVGAHAFWVVALALALTPLGLAAIRDGFRLLVDRARAPRASFTLVAALLAGAALCFGYYPALAAQLSPKEVFDAYGRLAGRGEPLGLLGVRARSAAYYAGSDVESVADVTRAYSFLTEQENQRRWLILKADDLPRLNALYRSHHAQNLPVLDGRSSQIVLASNTLSGRPNESWVGSMILDDPPHPAAPLDIAFEDQLEAFGWEVTDRSGRLVDSVLPGTGYHLRFYYRVLRPITGTWKAFVHIDGYQRRFNGDHDALGGKYAMNLWQPGDVVADDLELQLEPNFTPGDYAVYFGFFSGEARFHVTRGTHHDNRAFAGALHVR